VLRQFLFEVSGEGGREPGGHAGLDGDDVEKDQPLADDFTYEWPVRHGFEGQVRGACDRGRYSCLNWHTEMATFVQKLTSLGSVVVARSYPKGEDEQRCVFLGFISGSTRGERNGQTTHLLCNHFGSSHFIRPKVDVVWPPLGISTETLAKHSLRGFGCPNR
jgi:hypothetical protein